MKTKITTEVVTKGFARSGPDLHPNQIRLDDEAQTDKNKVFTQSDVNRAGGGGGGVAPDLSGYAKTDYVDSADNALGALIAANTQAIEDIEIPEGSDLSAYAKTTYVDAGDKTNADAIAKETKDRGEERTNLLNRLNKFNPADAPSTLFPAAAGANKALYVRDAAKLREDNISFSVTGSGSCTAAEFIGDGSKLTGLPTPEAPEVDLSEIEAELEAIHEQLNHKGEDLNKTDESLQHQINGLRDEVNQIRNTYATTESVDQKIAALPSATYVDWDNLPNLTTG